jgi:hypothetical protein
MNPQSLQLIWANKPGCSKAVAEFWIGDDDLWFTVFMDDKDKSLKVEVLPPAVARTAHVIDLSDVEHLIETAKHELLAMPALRP